MRRSDDPDTGEIPGAPPWRDRVDVRDAWERANTAAERAAKLEERADKLEASMSGLLERLDDRLRTLEQTLAANIGEQRGARRATQALATLGGVGMLATIAQVLGVLPT